MAKRATSKPQGKAASAQGAAITQAGVSTATPLSTEVSSLSSVDSPVEVLWVLPPQAPLSEIVVGSERVLTDAAGDVYAEGDLQSEDSIQPPDAERAAEAASPAVLDAQSYQTGHGVPVDAVPSYFTPAPPDLRTRAQRERDENAACRGK